MWGGCGLGDKWTQWLNCKDIHSCIKDCTKECFLGIYILKLILFNTLTSDVDEDREDMVIKFV